MQLRGAVLSFNAPPDPATQAGVDYLPDGVVDFGDLIEVLAAWGPCPGCCPADLDYNGTVDFEDLLILLTHWSA